MSLFLLLMPSLVRLSALLLLAALVVVVSLFRNEAVLSQGTVGRRRRAPPPRRPPRPSPPPVAVYKQQCLAGANAGGTRGMELWADVVKRGSEAPGFSAASAYACCTACAETNDCNVWVWCHKPSSCGTQCWLKRVGSRDQLTTPHASGDSVPWTTGSFDGKAMDIGMLELLPVEKLVKLVGLSTPYGRITLRLRPDWSAESVAYVRTLVSAPDLCTSSCEFYRAEPGFLLQGSLRARFAPNKVTRPGPRIMVRGDVGWAGGSAGPDFFIYLGAAPAQHWGTEHTVWAEVADEASLAVADTLAALPAPAPPGEMHILTDRQKIAVEHVEEDKGYGTSTSENR